MISITSALMGLLIAVSAEQVFEAQTLSNFFSLSDAFSMRFIRANYKFACVSASFVYILPLTYGTDILNGAFVGTNTLPPLLCFGILLIFAVSLFLICRHCINKNGFCKRYFLISSKTPPGFT